MSPQAKYLAQIILVGAQVVGRAFMRALRQELAGRSSADTFGPGCCSLDTVQHRHRFSQPLSQNTSLLPVPQGCAQRGHLLALHRVTVSTHILVPAQWQFGLG